MDQTDQQQEENQQQQLAVKSGKAGETAAREKALEQGAIEISDVIFQEEQQNAMAYGMDLFLGSEVHVEVIGKMDFTS